MELTRKRLALLSSQGWAVHTTQQIVQESITNYLNQSGGSGYGPARIKYYGNEIEVYKVPFEAVLLLVNRKATQGLTFTCYHDEKNDNMWTLWREERKTSRQKMKKASEEGVIKKGAMQFRQRSHRKE